MDDERQHRLLAWYDAEARDLPWRRTRDPYAVLVSEFMLQQTQAARVADRYVGFMAAFPTVGALAAASPGAVIRSWQGLGYNRRAVALHDAAAAIVARHDGRIPRDPEQLQALPGIGPYTARAIPAFAYDAPVAPVDVNIARVLARAVTGRALTKAQAQQVADGQVARPLPAARRPGAWSQALMDLGASHCGARRPRCGACPVRALCTWQRDGGDDPAARSAVRARPQAPFHGSDRQYRGRLLDALRDGPVAHVALPGALSLTDDPDRAWRLVRALQRDGLVRDDGNHLTLP